MKMMFHEEARNNNHNNIKRKMKMSKNDKRRFSDEQIRCLELMFESDTKLEPRKKVEVARELGLQPRQVAIWFQNKRARWKSKHIEKEYSSLLSSYNTLASQFESLKKEKQSLLIQLQKLKKESEKENDGGVRYGSSDGESESNNSNNNNNNNNNKIEVEVEAEVKNDDLFVEGMMVSNSDDDYSNLNAELLQVREEEEINQDESLLRMVDTSDWGSLDSDDIIINHAANQWLGFSSFID